MTDLNIADASLSTSNLGALGTPATVYTEITEDKFFGQIINILQEGTKNGESRDYITNQILALAQKNPKLANQLEFPNDHIAIKAKIVDPWFLHQAEVPTENKIYEPFSTDASDKKFYYDLSYDIADAAEKQASLMTAEAMALGNAPYGQCAKGIRIVLDKLGFVFRSEGNKNYSRAYEYAPALEKSPYFQEVTVRSNSDLPSLSDGNIVVWNKSKLGKSGHISASLGDGREASDHVHKQYTSNHGNTTDFRVFKTIPIKDWPSFTECIGDILILGMNFYEN